MSDSAENRRSPPFVLLGVIALIAAAMLGGVWYYLGHSSEQAPKQIREFTIVKILPPPPPPPPPPPQQPKMVEQPKLAEPAFKEEKPIDKPLDKPKDEPIKSAKADEPPPGPLSLDAKATGPGDLFNLGGKAGGSPFGEGGGGGGGGGSRWGWYASIVQSQIEAALRANERTRNAIMQVKIRLWADATGRISRVQLVSSTGDADLDALIRNDVLGSIVLREPPPKDMPMPMVTRVTARHPS